MTMQIKKKILNNGVIHVTYGGPEPEFIRLATPSNTDKVELGFLDVPVLVDSAKNKYDLPYTDYQTLLNEFINNPAYPTLTYSARNTFNTYKENWATGKFMTMQQFIDFVYGQWAGTSAPMSFADFLAGKVDGEDEPVQEMKDNAVITFASGGYTIKVLGSQINENASQTWRASYDANRQNPQPRFCGFIYDSVKGDIRFAIGQLENTGDLKATEQTSQMFTSMVTGGFSLDFSRSATPAKWGEIRAFIGDEGTMPLPTPATGSSGTAIPIVAGSFVRVNIDQLDYLSDARIYYTFDGREPSPFIDPILNETAAKYLEPGTPAGADYTDGLQFTATGAHVLTVKAYGQGATDSDSYVFKFTVS